MDRNADTIGTNQPHASVMFESLEGRELMSVTFNNFTKALVVTGTPNADALQVNKTAPNIAGVTHTQVFENGVRTFSSASTIRSITINAGGGDDFVTIGSGVIGCAVDGGAGRDRLYGGENNDIIDGGIDGDEIYGAGGHDQLIGGTGRDEMYGGAGNDVLHADAGTNDRDYLDGGTDDDTVYADYYEENNPWGAGIEHVIGWGGF